jgi:hypothetical protein
MDIVGVKIGSVDEASVDGVGIASAVVFEGRLSEIGGEGRVRDPSGCLLELNRG